MSARRVCMLAVAIVCGGAMLIAPVVADSPPNTDAKLVTPSSNVPVGSIDANTPALVETNEGKLVPKATPKQPTGKAYGSRGVVFDGTPGLDAPPPLLGGFFMTPFEPDPAPLATPVSEIPVPAAAGCGGNILLAPTMDHNAIGSGWASWSHGYTGDVYTAYAALPTPPDLVMTMPADTCAVYFYVEPNTFTPEFSVECIANAGLASETSSGPVMVLGDSGATYFGFYASGTDHIETVTVIVDPAANGFAVGEFGIACGAECVTDPIACCIESTGTCTTDVEIADCIAQGGRFEVGVNDCSLLTPLCGAQIGACCMGEVADPGYEPYECVGDMTQAACGAFGEETNWTQGESCDAVPPFHCNEPTYCDVIYSDCSDTPRTECVSAGAPDDWITNVTFADINNDSYNEPCPDSYGDYTGLVAYVAIGVSYDLSVTFCSEGSWTQHVTAWIDWNQDKVFEASEYYELGSGVDATLVLNIAVPPTAIPGFTRMRVIENYNAAQTDPCAGGTYGETEDYTIQVGGDVPTGACCDPTTGICTEDVLATDCLSPSQFAMDQTCSAAFPNCGNPGACCDDLTGDCNDDVLELDCAGTRFVPGGECAELNPECGDVAFIFVTDPGQGPPPAVQCGCTMTVFPDDARPTMSDVNDVPLPCPTGGDLAFSIPMSHRKIGDGWAGWSHGYTGDVYYTNGAFEVTLTLPAGSCGFYCYVEPNPFEVHSFTMTVNGMLTSDPFDADGSAGAAYAGVCGEGLSTITISSATTDFAIGEFGVCCMCTEVWGACCDPTTGICAENVSAYDCLPPSQFSEGTCFDAFPDCGEPGACCDDVAGTCVDDVLALDCPGRHAPGMLCGDDPFTPACGEANLCKIMYAPCEEDNPGFRAAVSAITVSDCDYFDPRAATPTLAELLEYDAVFTWVNYAYLDSVAMGDVLADYLEAGGRVILGQWTADSGQNNKLDGRIMSEYAIVTLSGRTSGTYNMDGATCIHAVGPVGVYASDYWDDIGGLVGTAQSDGTRTDGLPSVAYLPSMNLFYSSGNTGASIGTGDWAQLTANMACACEGVLMFGSCCAPALGICADGVEIGCCPPGYQWSQDSCADRVPQCGNAGACCNPTDGTCEDNVYEVNCPVGYRFVAGEQCAELEPECGTPGACCDDNTGLCTDDFEANCAGRFIAGETCATATFDPPCGEWTCGGILYVPANDDDPTWRAEVSTLTGQPCDYWDPRVSTPTLEDLADYCCVVTWVNNAYLDNVAMGDVLADYVDANGKVILGQWCLPTAGNFLSGRVMTAGYMPASASGQTGSDYSGDGTDCVFDLVNTFAAQYRDVASVLAGNMSDGTFLDGAPACIWRPDRLVYSAPGLAVGFTTGEVAQYIANMCFCTGEDRFGACCDEVAGTCAEGVEMLECFATPSARFIQDGLCADFDPPCGQISGACCNVVSGECIGDTHFASECDGTWYEGESCTDPGFECPMLAAGDTCETAILVDQIPYQALGDTSFVDLTHDYDEECTYTGSTSRDVVYEYTPATDVTVMMTLCGQTTYDSKLYVYENTCPAPGTGPTGTQFACNDDFCTSAAGQSYVSELSEASLGANLNLVGGNTYYIVVDGYGGNEGTYDLEIIPITVTLGACCVDGVCTDDVAEPACAGIWYDGQACVDVEPCPVFLGACCVAGVCTDDLWQSECAGTWYDGQTCLDVEPCPATPDNDECVNATPVAGPYPQTVYGDNTLATVDCPGLLDWNATWWAIDLPYASNNLNIDFCPTMHGEQPWLTGGIVVYNDCLDCGAYNIAAFYNFDSYCPEQNLSMGWTALPGPGTILFPAYYKAGADEASAVDIPYGLNIDVTDAGGLLRLRRADAKMGTIPQGRTQTSVTNQQKKTGSKLDADLRPAQDLSSSATRSGSTPAVGRVR